MNWSNLAIPKLILKYLLGDQKGNARPEKYEYQVAYSFGKMAEMMIVQMTILWIQKKLQDQRNWWNLKTSMKRYVSSQKDILTSMKWFGKIKLMVELSLQVNGIKMIHFISERIWKLHLIDWERQLVASFWNPISVIRYWMTVLHLCIISEPYHICMVRITHIRDETFTIISSHRIHAILFQSRMYEPIFSFTVHLKIS